MEVIRYELFHERAQDTFYNTSQLRAGQQIQDDHDKVFVFHRLLDLIIYVSEYRGTHVRLEVDLFL